MVKDYTKLRDRQRKANRSDRVLPSEPIHEEHGHASMRSEPHDSPRDMPNEQTLKKVQRGFRKAHHITLVLAICLAFGAFTTFTESGIDNAVGLIMGALFFLFISLKIRKMGNTIPDRLDGVKKMMSQLSHLAIPDEVGTRIAELQREGSKIDAIKYVRQEMNLGLREAKFVVENYVDGKGIHINFNSTRDEER